MTTAAIIRLLLISTFFAGAAACRDVGVVGEGSTCPEACEADEQCVRGACVHRDEGDGAAGDDGHEEEEHEEEEDEHEDEPSELPRE